MPLRWLNKQRFDASRPASGRLPANSCHFRQTAPDQKTAYGFVALPLDVGIMLPASLCR